MPESQLTARTHRWHWVLATVAGALFLLLPAALNGFPLVNSDDGTYIHAAATNEPPEDRPVLYSILIRLFSLGGTSLWWVCGFQALILAFLVIRTGRRAVNFSPLAGFLTVTAVSLLSAASWLSSELIPDVFTGIAFLALFLILLNREALLTRVLLYVLYAAAAGTHVSHIMIFGLLPGGCLLRWLWLRLAVKSVRPLVPLLVSLLVTIASVGWMLMPIRESGHVFAMGALLDQGILKSYLDERCPTVSYKLCKYKDTLNPDPNYFLWDWSSPLHKEGGWKGTKKEYDEILNSTWTTPKYLAMHIRASVNATRRQLCAFGIGDGNAPFPEGTHVFTAVREYIPSDTAMYAHAAQQLYSIQNAGLLTMPNTIIYIAVIAGLIVILPALYSWRRLPAALRNLMLLSLAGIIANAWVCGTFSNVLGRYGSRMMWLIPLCALLCAWSIFKRSERRTGTGYFGAKT